jgi:DNA-binding transcriptional LysR family regulator
MLDLELLHTLVCVVDERSFTRAGERVHRTQSTVSQQIRKLEERLGHALLLRDRSGSQVTPTEQGELLATYARRLLALAQEAEEALGSAGNALLSLRIGVPEDFDARRMSGLLSGFAARQPGLRLETISGMSSDLQRRLAGGELDIALVKRVPGEGGPCIAAWPETLVWAGPTEGQLLSADEPIPLALFPQGCVYRQRALAGLDQARRRWRIAFGSHSLSGIQAAVSSGLGISVLPTTALLPEHRVCEGLPALPPTELALLSASNSPGLVQRHLLDTLCEALRS